MKFVKIETRVDDDDVTRDTDCVSIFALIKVDRILLTCFISTKQFNKINGLP